MATLQTSRNQWGTKSLEAALATAFANALKTLDDEAQVNVKALKEVKSESDIRKAAGETFGEEASAAIDAWIKTATVTTAVTTVVATSGGPGTGAGAGTGIPGTAIS
jgi:hypothetical protein